MAVTQQNVRLSVILSFYEQRAGCVESKLLPSTGVFSVRHEKIWGEGGRRTRDLVLGSFFLDSGSGRYVP